MKKNVKKSILFFSKIKNKNEISLQTAKKIINQ